MHRFLGAGTNRDHFWTDMQIFNLKGIVDITLNTPVEEVLELLKNWLQTNIRQILEL
jgi:hypothetical protein